MNKSIDEAFLETFEDLKLPENISSRFEAVMRLDNKRNSLCETYLLCEKQNKNLFLLKCYQKKEELFHYVNESKILSMLSHKGIPKILPEYEIETEDCIYSMREYIEGITLDNYLAEYTVDEEKAAGIIMQICDILSYLHNLDEPVIHRDIKPTNIIINPNNNNVYLIDFGISRIFNEKTEMDTFFAGTRNYAAPEQYGFSQTDNRTDIFALGMLLRFLLTGQVRKNITINNKTLERIVTKCTQIDSAKRFTSAAALKKALLEYKTQKKKKIAICVSAFLAVCIAFAALFPVFNQYQKDKLTDEARLRAFFLQNENNRLIVENLGWDINDRTTWTDVIWSNEDSSKAYEIYFRNLGFTGKLDVSGFMLLKIIVVRNNQLSYFNAANCANLVHLDCSSNKLKNLDLSGLPNLSILDFENNDLNIIDLSKLKNLTRLSCGNNYFPRLDISNNTNLTFLLCLNNYLVHLNLENNINLEYLHCSQNMLMDLDVSKLNKLEELYCNENKLSFLDVSNNTALRILHINSNRLEDIDLSKNAALTHLKCETNRLATFPSIENFTRLLYITMDNNRIFLADENVKKAIDKIEETINRNSPILPDGWKDEVTSSPEKWEQYFGKPYDEHHSADWWDWGTMIGKFTYKPQNF